MFLSLGTPQKSWEELSRDAKTRDLCKGAVCNKVRNVKMSSFIPKGDLWERGQKRLFIVTCFFLINICYIKVTT